MWLFHFCKQNLVVLSEVWETMQGRHIKTGNVRKRKRAVWPPLPHLQGDTGGPGEGKGMGGGGIMEKVLCEINGR